MIMLCLVAQPFFFFFLFFLAFLRVLVLVSGLFPLQQTQIWHGKVYTGPFISHDASRLCIPFHCREHLKRDAAVPV